MTEQQRLHSNFYLCFSNFFLVEFQKLLFEFTKGRPPSHVHVRNFFTLVFYAFTLNRFIGMHSISLKQYTCKRTLTFLHERILDLEMSIHTPNEYRVSLVIVSSSNLSLLSGHRYERRRSLYGFETIYFQFLRLAPILQWCYSMTLRIMPRLYEYMLSTLCYLFFS